MSKRRYGHSDYDASFMKSQDQSQKIQAHERRVDLEGTGLSHQPFYVTEMQKELLIKNDAKRYQYKIGEYAGKEQLSVSRNSTSDNSSHGISDDEQPIEPTGIWLQDLEAPIPYQMAKILRNLDRRIQRLEQAIVQVITRIGLSLTGTCRSLYTLHKEETMHLSSASFELSPNDQHTSLIKRVEGVDKSMTIRKRDLEQACTQSFFTSPDPPLVELYRIVRMFEFAYSHMEHRKILSEVRKWFRKRREEYGQKIFMICSSVFPEPYMDRKELDQAIESTRNNLVVQDEIIRLAGLEAMDQESARRFCCNKVESYLKRRFIF